VKGGWIYHGGCTDLFAALGAGKCRLYVIPSLNMVALRQGDSPSDRYLDSTFLSLLLHGREKRLLPRDSRCSPIVKERDLPPRKARYSKAQSSLRGSSRTGNWTDTR